MLIKGSEMNLQDYRRQFGFKTAWRLLDNAYGQYDDIQVIEAEEIVRATNTMTEEEILYCRPLHWMIFFIQSYGYYSKLICFLKILEVPIIGFFKKLLDNYTSAPLEVVSVFEDFQREAKEEFFESFQTITEHYKQQKN